MTRHSASRLAALFALSSAGGLAAAFLGLPVPYLFGSALVSVVLGITGFAPRRVPGSISVGARVAIGVMVGASLQIEFLDRLSEIGLAALLVPVQIALVLAVGSALLRRTTRMSASERLLGVLPGGFSSVVLSVDALGHDVRHITMYHAIRVLAIVTLVPLALDWGLSTGGTGNPAARSGLLALSGMEAGGFILLGVAGWTLARITRLPGGPILFPLVVTVSAKGRVRPSRGSLGGDPRGANNSRSAHRVPVCGGRNPGASEHALDGAPSHRRRALLLPGAGRDPALRDRDATQSRHSRLCARRCAGDQRSGLVPWPGPKLRGSHSPLAHGDRACHAAHPAAMDGTGRRGGTRGAKAMHDQMSPPRPGAVGPRSVLRSRAFSGERAR